MASANHDILNGSPPGGKQVPKYDYRCSAGHQYEKREGFDAPPMHDCQVCGVEARRVLTPPAIVFKGSGWYVTDSRKSSSPASADTAASAPAADAPASSEAKTETAGESKPESTVSAPPAAAASE